MKKNNRIIVRWTSETTATTFTGNTEKMNIDRVVIAKDLKIVRRTVDPKSDGATFPLLNDFYYGYDAANPGAQTPSFRIEVGATLTVADDAFSEIEEDDHKWSQEDKGNVMVLINGKLFAGTHSKLQGDVKYDGAGVFEYSGWSEECTWTKGDFKGNY